MPMSIKFKCQMRSLYNQRIWGSGQRQSVHEGRQGRGWRRKPRKSALPWLSPESDPLNPTPTSVSLPPRPLPVGWDRTSPPQPTQLVAHMCVARPMCLCTHSLAPRPWPSSPCAHTLLPTTTPTPGPSYSLLYLLSLPAPGLHRCMHVSPEEPRTPTPGSCSHPSVHPRPQVACRLVGCLCRNREN